jgi:hypothetical protein
MTTQQAELQDETPLLRGGIPLYGPRAGRAVIPDFGLLDAFSTLCNAPEGACGRPRIELILPEGTDEEEWLEHSGGPTGSADRAAERRGADEFLPGSQGVARLPAAGLPPPEGRLHTAERLAMRLGELESASHARTTLWADFSESPRRGPVDLGPSAPAGARQPGARMLAPAQVSASSDRASGPSAIRGKAARPDVEPPDLQPFATAGRPPARNDPAVVAPQPRSVIMLQSGRSATWPTPDVVAEARAAVGAGASIRPHAHGESVVARSGPMTSATATMQTPSEAPTAVRRPGPAGLQEVPRRAAVETVPMRGLPRSSEVLAFRADAFAPRSRSAREEARRSARGKKVHIQTLHITVNRPPAVASPTPAVEQPQEQRPQAPGVQRAFNPWLSYRGSLE